MERKSTRLWDELTNFYTSAWIDLPLAAMRQAFGVKGDDLRRVGWRAYDSWIALMNEATNELYSNRAFADASGRALEAAFTIRHISDQFATAASVAFAAPTEPSVVVSDPRLDLEAREYRPGGRSVTTGRARNSGAKAA
jgi:hypothetical protein